MKEEPPRLSAGECQTFCKVGDGIMPGKWGANSDKTAFRWCKAGRLDVYQLNTVNASENLVSLADKHFRSLQ
jgi:hypothetical protein